ncbi:DUF3413 domain-containing protein [Pseudoalteromonas sp. T1lg22]|uniref:DUF3413 domain-containing protein n=1 Tax=Pseudoalteromonas sp. T1lg22 TaxID=2077096 RepID=UPI000CF6CC68|nr:DUF3413 domain-containing protein [Pseudoalteromonas sp. T1lg22]
MNLTTQNQFSSRVSQLLAWGHWFTLANIGLALLLSLAYLFADAHPATAIGTFYMVVTWLSHTAFITFLAFVLTIFPLSLVFPYPRHIRGMASVLATIGMTLLAVDAFVYYNLGYHLNYSALGEILSLFWRNVSNTPALSTLMVSAFVMLILAYQLIVSNYAWHHLGDLKRLRIGRTITTALVVCFALSHSIHIWADAELKFDITKQDNMLPLSYPTTAKSLLAKNDLLDLKRYEQQRSVNVNAPNVSFVMPAQLPSCNLAPDAAAVDIRLFSTQADLARFTQANPTLQQVAPILHPTSAEDTIFNALYGLPSYYRQSMSKDHIDPLWRRTPLTLQTNLAQFDFIHDDADALVKVSLDEHTPVQDSHTVFAFTLASESTERITTINQLWSSDTRLQGLGHIVQPQDILATVLAEHWQCPELAASALIANNMLGNDTQPNINYSQGVFIALRKDRITLLSSDGSYKHISASEGFNVDQELNVPFLIQGLKQLKRFNAQ